MSCKICKFCYTKYSEISSNLFQYKQPGLSGTNIVTNEIAKIIKYELEELEKKIQKQKPEQIKPLQNQLAIETKPERKRKAKKAI